MGAPLHLVACVKAKASHPMPAADLYQSAWFKKARAYVEARNAPWFILSALHGLVDPKVVIAPYDMTLIGMSSHERDAWGQRVIAQLQERQISTNTEIVVLAGEKYRKPLAGWLGDRATVPMRGLGIGEQLSWLKHIT
ncbi:MULTISPECIES: DUF6884 domain-containing protein [Brucella]|uniref:DUF6884 domain-containing protein n=1 Tax=Brucella tritici TaxID=94626 RepID=A0A6L3YD44_9HYPH|nr:MULTISPECIES: DUF6884 domain-containing protein [Brucella]KAB2681186.1 hypothetical protein F9L08_20010 [Brucella tritici]KAB2757332.1 hypothetical protein F9K98_23325 [Brucella anthropi]KAB2775261.1 hypothetical protein F9K99_22700 [Brucella anthropi]